MAIAHRASDVATPATGATVTNNVPAGTVDGDVLIWRISDTSTTTTATPTGWTLLVNKASASITQMTVFYRVASSEPASYSATITSARATGIMSAYSGVDNTTPLDVAAPAGVAGTTTVTCPAITPVTVGAWVLGFADAQVATGVLGTTYSSSNLDAIDGQGTTASGSATNNVAATGHFAWTSGAFTPAFTTSNASTRTVGLTAALRPAVASRTPISNTSRARFRASIW